MDRAGRPGGLSRACCAHSGRAPQAMTPNRSVCSGADMHACSEHASPYPPLPPSHHAAVRHLPRYLQRRHRGTSWLALAAHGGPGRAAGRRLSAGDVRGAMRAGAREPDRRSRRGADVAARHRQAHLLRRRYSGSRRPLCRQTGSAPRECSRCDRDRGPGARCTRLPRRDRGGRRGGRLARPRQRSEGRARSPQEGSDTGTGPSVSSSYPGTGKANPGARGTRAGYQGVRAPKSIVTTQTASCLNAPPAESAWSAPIPTSRHSGESMSSR